MSSRRDLIRRLGFGAAKCNLSPVSEAALGAALRHGVRVIDTAPNYGHEGGSERLIGQVLKQQQVKREEVVLSTKFGYYMPKPGSPPSPDSIAVRDTQWRYSLHPDVVRSELLGSLERLQQEYVDVLYVHSPEHYVADLLLRGQEGEEQAASPAAIAAEKAKLRTRLCSTFAALEELVSEGKIRAYGVSSNGLAAPASDPAHLSLDDVMEAASEGASRAGRVVPALRSVQMPINVLEPGGLLTAFKARSKGLEVVANRPLTGFYQGGMYRLIDKWADQPPQGYMEACQAVLEYFVYKPEAQDK